jgi:hypothetical protein
MNTLPIKEYNAKQTSKWHEHWDKAKEEGRNWGCMLQLAFYIFEKNYGYVAFDEKCACWAKTKHEAIDYYSLTKKY